MTVLSRLYSKSFGQYRFLDLGGKALSFITGLIFPGKILCLSFREALQD